MSYNGIGLPAIGTIVQVIRDIGSTYADELYRMVIPEGSHVKVIAHAEHSHTGNDLVVIEWDSPEFGTFIRQLIPSLLTRIKTIEELREESVRTILESVGVDYDDLYVTAQKTLLELHKRGKLVAE